MASSADIEALSRDIAACRLCVDRPVGKPLAHAPRPVAVLSTRARILIAGQAPGLPASLTMSEEQKDALFKRFIEWQRGKEP